MHRISARDGIQDAQPLIRHLRSFSARCRRLKPDKLSQNEGADIGRIKLPALIGAAKHYQCRDFVRTKHLCLPDPPNPPLPEAISGGNALRFADGTIGVSALPRGRFSEYLACRQASSPLPGIGVQTGTDFARKTATADGEVVHYVGFKRFLLSGPVEKTSLADFSGGFGFRVQTTSQARYIVGILYDLRAGRADQRNPDRRAGSHFEQLVA